MFVPPELSVSQFIPVKTTVVSDNNRSIAPATLLLNQ
jgi:hypothetical protein